MSEVTKQAGAIAQKATTAIARKFQEAMKESIKDTEYFISQENDAIRAINRLLIQIKPIILAGKPSYDVLCQMEQVESMKFILEKNKIRWEGLKKSVLR